MGAEQGNRVLGDGDKIYLCFSASQIERLQQRQCFDSRERAATNVIGPSYERCVASTKKKV